MAFDHNNPIPQIGPRAAGRIAIVGAGVSGLIAAYELSRTHNVTLYEAAPRLGGHARTVMAGRNGDQPVDTGFIVYNDANYPTLRRIFDELDVPTKASDMSFSASIGEGNIEYGLRDLPALVAQGRNMVRPGFWRMLSDVLRFNRRALETARDPAMPLSALLDRLRLGDWFRRYYLLPLSGAIWSATPEQMEGFPARTLVQFFDNHALLSYRSHRWRTVDGGSIEYVNRIASAIRNRGGEIRTGAPVAGIMRGPDCVWLRGTDGRVVIFDQVIMACHSDDALRLLEDAGAHEQQVLGAMRYQDNNRCSALRRCADAQAPAVLGVLGVPVARGSAQAPNRSDLLDELAAGDRP